MHEDCSWHEVWLCPVTKPGTNYKSIEFAFNFLNFSLFSFSISLLTSLCLSLLTSLCLNVDRRWILLLEDIFFQGGRPYRYTDNESMELHRRLTVNTRKIFDKLTSPRKEKKGPYVPNREVLKLFRLVYFFGTLVRMIAWWFHLLIALLIYLICRVALLIYLFNILDG